jgi:hypothetical protein
MLSGEQALVKAAERPATVSRFVIVGVDIGLQLRTRGAGRNHLRALPVYVAGACRDAGAAAFPPTTFPYATLDAVRATRRYAGEQR